MGILQKKYNISFEEEAQIEKCMEIFSFCHFSKHYEINNFITENNQWDDFIAIRSFNNHGNYKKLKGIQPKFFVIICKELKLKCSGGVPLDSYSRY